MLVYTISITPFTAAILLTSAARLRPQARSDNPKRPQAGRLPRINPDPAMIDGTCMRPPPTTSSLGDIHLAIADGLLCLRFDGENKLSFAKAQPWMQDGSTDGEDCEWTTSDVEALGPAWQGYQPHVARVHGGRFDGLRAVGLALN